ncbi:DEKNAAC104164 [Brettanomyces naardenensis]|uniref:DEKNAAC104164 n=1 Tax=Brettanomyces naardenensis TaxID=13370 RepID=A0A448YQ80_BRENA|nr:DEKNAAC104164 [Brettanomyces naardenensis]
MASYNVNSTKSYMHAMEPMIAHVSELEVGDEDSFKLPHNIVDGDVAEARTDTWSKDMRSLLKSFEGVERDLLMDYVDSGNESGSEESEEEDGAEDFRLLDRIQKQCERVCLKQFGEDEEGAKGQASQLLGGLVNILKVQNTDEGLQSALFDALGYEELELISEVIQKKEEIIKEYEGKMRSPKREAVIPSHHHLLNEEDLHRQFESNLERSRNVHLEKNIVGTQKYPHVYQTNQAGNVLSVTGKKYTLPIGSTRESYENHEEILIPPSERKPANIPDADIAIRDLDFLCQGTFKGYKTLNKMQSLVYDVAYNTNENLLVCAPTGAGKTDVALLTILHTISQFVTEMPSGSESVQVDIDYEEFKIIYVAPLKALAAEIVDKFSKKLAWLGIQVRELTGDMQLTKAEIMATQIIVTTPEKWDVVTRKANGDTELVEKVKLLIIDEVHLLHEDRGSVIETLVARTLRQVESTQSMIRIAGLSATLPNYVDVADFLGVNRNVGMFYFDQSFRPVPLEQQLLGVRAKAGSKQAREKLELVAFNKVIDMLTLGHQVMVFVHSRKDTVRTARSFIHMAREQQLSGYFDCTDSPKYQLFEREMGKNKNKDMRELFGGGFGVHHAGMMRADRNLTEKMFISGSIKVLCCTATLAWGVNLPAAAVIIKGTQVYDSKAGGFIDLGISDVLQIFGRAGRPQYESHGVGILCTTSDRLDHYVTLLLEQHAIESKLAEKLVDNLNAEISLGTVTNVDEGVQWLGYTYLNVRMKKNPFAYAIDWKQLAQDPMLVQKRREMIITAARKLHSLQMIVFDERSTALIPKDLGRVASDFYLLSESVEVFNQLINPQVTEADVLSIISMSSEFDNIKFREEERKELDGLKENNSVVCEIDPKLETSQAKTNILLQSFISRASVRDSALFSDTNYIAQNSARICRALFLIGLGRRWGSFARGMLSICKAVDRRIWPFQHPLRQYQLQEPIMKQIEAKNPSIESLREMSSSELGEFVHNKRMGSVLYKLIGRFPYLLLDAECFPVTSNVLRLHITIAPDFTWSYEYHGNIQFFWILVEESERSNILHSEKYILNKRALGSEHELDVSIPLSDPPPKQIVIRALSDTWMGCETTHAISFQHLIKPYNETTQTKLLKLQPLPVSALHDPQIEAIYREKFSYFNPMQTMTFHTLYYSNSNVFVGSPTGSGKTVVAELAMWHAFRESPHSKIVYIAPMKALVRERVDDWKTRICDHTSHRIVELTGDSLPDAGEVREADIIVTTPEKFDGISRNWQTRKFVQNVSLVVMDEIHLLASDRGPILEIIVSRMNYISSFTKKPIRLLGLSTAVSNAMDMAGWLRVKDGLFNFPPSIRPVPLQMFIDGFPDNLAFSALMKTMNKPAFMAIKQHSPKKPVLIFVPSRRQTRLTALDLIHLCGMEDNPRRFNRMNEEELEPILAKVKDDTLKLSLQFGIGLHHAGLVQSDRRISHRLFEQGKIQILVATSTLAWGVNLPAFLVIIKGTQFFDAKIEGYKDMDLTDILQMMGRAGRPAFDTSGVAMVFTKENKKSFYKHFLNVGFPVESSLHKVLDDHIGAEIASGTIKSRQDALDFLTWTFLYRRAHHNPTYYGVEDVTPEGISKYLSGLIDGVINDLKESKCLISSGDRMQPTPFLQISSYYYLSHKTMRTLLKQVKSSATFRECLRWLAEASEYDELPTRHGEELINTEMSQEMRYPAEDLEGCEFIWDPHVKAFLLLQAYMSRVEMPIADYSQDTVSVLDQSLRILQAYIDATSELGYLSTVLMMIKLMQCIKQCCWFDQDFVYTLPGLTPHSLPEGSYDEDGSHWHSSKIEELTIRSVGEMSHRELEQLAGKLHKDRKKREQFMKVASTIPVGAFKISQDSLDEVTVEIDHKNHSYRSDFKVYAPRFSKPQRETWFVMICDLQKDELIAIKRESPRRHANIDKVVGKIKVEDSLRGKTVDVIAMSDFTDIYYRGRISLLNE